MASWSQAPRGLFVLPRVTRICTGPAVSPGPSSRQRPRRDAFRAGRNLPDKEFRYLRTVIVTAAVYRGFPSGLTTPPVNLPALGRRQPLYVGFPPSQRPVVLVTSRVGRFAATPSGLACAIPYPGHPFSRSYGVNLPSSLTRAHPSTWVCSTCRPGSVCGTDTAWLARGFSRQPRRSPLGGARRPPSHSRLRHGRRDLPRRLPYPAWTVALTAGPAPLRPPIAHHARPWGRTVDRLSIAYGRRPRLRPASPAADEHRCGTLRHSVGRIRTALALLVPAFALAAAPGGLPTPLPRRRRRSPTAQPAPARSLDPRPRWWASPRDIVGARALDQ